MVEMNAAVREMERRYFAAQRGRKIGLDERGQGLAYDSRRGLAFDELDLSEIVQALRRMSRADLRRIFDALELDDDSNPEARESGFTAEGDRRRAVADVAPVMGAHDCLGFDSARTIYRVALGRLGVDVGAVHPSGYRDVFHAHLARRRSGGSPRIAQDATAAKSFAERFPGAADIQVMF